MRRKVSRRELDELRRRVLDVASRRLGKVVTTLEEAEAEFYRLDVEREEKNRHPLPLPAARKGRIRG